MTFLDISKHLRGLKSVDKIKKYRRDIPWDSFTHLGRRDSPHPTGSVNPDGRDVYKIPRESLLVFLIIIAIEDVCFMAAKKFRITGMNLMGIDNFSLFNLMFLYHIYQIKIMFIFHISGFGLSF